MEQQSLAINPTIFHDISETAEIANEEIFGPVLCIMEPLVTPRYPINRSIWEINMHCGPLS